MEKNQPSTQYCLFIVLFIPIILAVNNFIIKMQSLKFIDNKEPAQSSLLVTIEFQTSVCLIQRIMVFYF